jgi:hypothetical protein
VGRDGGEDESLKFITARETINCLTMGIGQPLGLMRYCLILMHVVRRQLSSY